MSAKKRGLGRGLDALLATSQASRNAQDNQPEQNDSELQQLAVELKTFSVKILTLWKKLRR